MVLKAGGCLAFSSLELVMVIWLRRIAVLLSWGCVEMLLPKLPSFWMFVAVVVLTALSS